MPYYFVIEDLLNDHSIKDQTLIAKANQHSPNFSLIEKLQILLENKIKNTNLLLAILDLGDTELYYFLEMIEILNQNKMLNEDILTQIIENRQFDKVFHACNTLKRFGLLTTETLQITDDIEKNVDELTKQYPIKKTYLYLKDNYASSMKWGLGCGLSLGISYYILASFKLLGISALHSHPLIGAAVISTCILILFLLGKACSQFVHHKKPSL